MHFISRELAAQAGQTRILNGLSGGHWLRVKRSPKEFATIIVSVKARDCLNFVTARVSATCKVNDPTACQVEKCC